MENRNFRTIFRGSVEMSFLARLVRTERVAKRILEWRNARKVTGSYGKVGDSLTGSRSEIHVCVHGTTFSLAMGGKRSGSDFNSCGSEKLSNGEEGFSVTPVP
jgi:hypothetical protein